MLRYTIQARLAGRLFETFHVDVGIGDPVIGTIEYLETTDLLDFVQLEPACVPCYPISTQIAEKLHAYTHIHDSGPSSRAKDFIDLILLAKLGPHDGDELSAAIRATFNKAGTHAIPGAVPPPPQDWRQPYRRNARSLGLEEIPFDEAYKQLQTFLDPVLAGRKNKEAWDPASWRWI